MITERLSERERARIKRTLAWIPPQWRQGATYWRWRRFLRMAQWWPADRIRAWQLERLQSIVRHAMESTEGYRELYRQAGVSAEDVQSLDDLRHLPLVTKEMLRDNLEAFSVKCRGRRYLTTGGSTGIPFGFYQTRRMLHIEDAFMHTGWEQVGWRLGVWTAVLRGAFVGTVAEPWKVDAFRRELSLSSYFLGPGTLGVYLQILRRYRPSFLHTYPSSLHILSDLLQEAGRAGDLTFAGILLGSENVYDWQLAKFGAAFPSARLFAWYGHAEKVILAPWCDGQQKYHAWPFYGLTEILGTDGAEVEEGEIGELVGTSFHNSVTPFIRYRTLDYARKGPHRCSTCGRQFQLLDAVIGRSHEFIVTSTGRHISMTAINMHDDIFDGLRQFQFAQTKMGEVTFCYVPKTQLPREELDRIRRGLMVKLGDDLVLDMKEVAEIPRTPSGKLRFLDQRLPVRYGDR